MCREIRSVERKMSVFPPRQRRRRQLGYGWVFITRKVRSLLPCVVNPLLTPLQFPLRHCQSRLTHKVVCVFLQSPSSTFSQRSSVIRTCFFLLSKETKESLLALRKRLCCGIDDAALIRNKGEEAFSQISSSLQKKK